MVSKLILPPDQASYGVSYGNELVAVALDGGAMRVRRDKVDVPHLVDVQWSLDEADYVYLMAFYRSATNYGALPFLIDLLIDGAVLIEYTCKLIPGSLQLAEQRGLLYVVTAQLEVQTNPDVDLDYDAGLVVIYEAYGADAANTLQELEDLVNTYL